MFPIHSMLEKMSSALCEIDWEMSKGRELFHEKVTKRPEALSTQQKLSRVKVFHPNFN